jgi:hypothetical protein
LVSCHGYFCAMTSTYIGSTCNVWTNTDPSMTKSPPQRSRNRITSTHRSKKYAMQHATQTLSVPKTRLTTHALHIIINNKPYPRIGYNSLILLLNSSPELHICGQTYLSPTMAPRATTLSSDDGEQGDDHHAVDSMEQIEVKIKLQVVPPPVPPRSSFSSHGRCIQSQSEVTADPNLRSKGIPTKRSSSSVRWTCSNDELTLERR